MTDPERISKRSTGLAAQLLRAGADEQPSDAGVQQTLAALGVSGAVLTTTSTASAAAAGTVKATSAAGASGAGFAATAAGGTVKAVSATLLVKWIGIGVVGGVGLAGAAAVATRPAAPARAEQALALAAPVVAAAPTPVASPQPVASVEPPTPEVVPSTLAAPARVSAAEPAASAPMLEVGAPLAAEVAYVDRARALLASGQSEQGLAMLRSYEREFPEARLLPEILFLHFETCVRLGRGSEARNAAQRLLDGFPRSPHAARARQVLAQ